MHVIEPVNAEDARMQEDVIEGFRLSPQQRHLWLTLAPGERCAQCAIVVEGELAPERLRGALRALGGRHEALRTDFRYLAGMDVPVQVPGADPGMDLEIHHLGASADLSREIDERLRLDAAGTLEGHATGLYTWLRFAPSGGALLITLPSLCADTRTFVNLYAQLADLCGEGEGTNGDGEFVQYADYSEWQNELIENHAGSKAAPYWAALAGADAALALEPAPDDAPQGTAEPVRTVLDPTVVQGLRTLCLEHGTDLRTAVLTALGVLVWRLRGQQSGVFGVLFDGRTIPGLANALGLFARYMPVELRIETDYSFVEALRRTRDALDQAEAAQDLFAPDSAASPPIKFEWHATPAPIGAGALRFSLLRHCSRIDRFQLRVTGIESDAGVTLEFEHDPAVHSAAAVECLAARLAALLADAAAAPQRSVSQAEVLPGPERKRLLEEWNQTQCAYPRDVCLHELFEQQARRTPEATAVICGEQSLSFAELDRAADALARVLRSLDVGPDVAAGVCLERSCWMLVAVLGIWKAGGAYVPIDPAQPPARLAFLAGDAGCRVVVTQQPLAGQLADIGCALVQVDAPNALSCGADTRVPPPRTLPANLAYVLYTSGSTGTPQGVMVRHGSAVNLAFALQSAVYREVGRPLTIALNAPLVFDASVKQLLQVVHGHSLCVIPEELRRDPAELAAYLAKHRVDAVDCTPSQLNLWLAAGMADSLQGLPATVLVGGEALDERLWRLLSQAPGKRCFNVYGPTECTVDTTIAPIRGGRPNIGRPLANMRTYVLDDTMNPVPTGSVGQLYVGGDGLARGYLRRPRLTADRFVPDPFSKQAGARLYRTGDLVRQLGDGRLDYLRRTDHQVKVQGIRVELPEIEKALREHPAVREAAVVVAKGEHEVERMIGYVLPRRRYLKKIDGYSRLTLPDGRAIAHRNRNESEYLYLEIFERRTYLRNGIALPPRAVVFDVGANIGMFSMLVAERCPEAELYAFEPIPPILEICRINAELYAPALRLFPFGLSSRNETAAFTYYPHYSMMSGRQAYSDAGADIDVIKRYLANQHAESAGGNDELIRHADEFLAGRFLSETYECALRRLSEVIASENVARIDLLKIDVQRAEMDVLEGIDEADWPKIRQVVLEVHDADGQETAGRTRKIAALLERHGFETLVEQDGELTGTDRYNVYASRHGLRPGAAAAAPGPSTAKSPADVLTAQELRTFLKERLPAYMVPASLALLEEMPLTRGGKIDRIALASSQYRAARAEEELLAPQTGLERQIAAIWQQLLGLEQIGSQDNFFDLGGHSLLLIQLHRRLCEELGAQILILDVFQHPTVAALAGLLQRKRSGVDAEARFDAAQSRAEKIRKAGDQRRQASKEWKDRL